MRIALAPTKRLNFFILELSFSWNYNFVIYFFGLDIPMETHFHCIKRVGKKLHNGNIVLF